MLSSVNVAQYLMLGVVSGHRGLGFGRKFEHSQADKIFGEAFDSRPPGTCLHITSTHSERNTGHW